MSEAMPLWRYKIIKTLKKERAKIGDSIARLLSVQAGPQQFHLRFRACMMMDSLQRVIELLSDPGIPVCCALCMQHDVGHVLLDLGVDACVQVLRRRHCDETAELPAAVDQLETMLKGLITAALSTPMDARSGDDRCTHKQVGHA